MRSYSFRLTVILTICLSFLFSNPWWWTHAQNQRPKIEGQHRPGKLEGVFPDLEDVQRVEC